MSTSGESCRSGDGHCITCGDEAIPMRAIELRDGLAVCAGEHGERQEVITELVDPVAPGDALLVHAGVAIRHLGMLT